MVQHNDSYKCNLCPGCEKVKSATVVPVAYDKQKCAPQPVVLGEISSPFLFSRFARPSSFPVLSCLPLSEKLGTRRASIQTSSLVVARIQTKGQATLTQESG